MMRVPGAFVVLLAGALAAFGAWLLYLTMGWAYPAFVPPELVPHGLALNLDSPPLTSLPGLAALVLIGFGGAFALLGLGMLVIGQRIRMLFNIAMAFVVIHAVAIAVVVKSSPG